MKKYTLPLKWLVPGVALVMLAMIALLGQTLKSTDSLTGDLKADVFSSFPDVEIESEEYDAINYLKRERILRGNQDGTFNPNGTLNRAEWATILVRLSGANPSLENYNNCFPDVTDQWFAPSICFAKTQGWITGYTAGELAGKYGPNIPVKDIEAIATLARLTGWDVDDGGEWYEPALKFAQKKKLYNENKPIKDIKRKEIADITFRMLASVALGFDEYNDNLKNNIERYGVYELTEVEIENYEDEYEDEYNEYMNRKRGNNPVSDDDDPVPPPVLDGDDDDDPAPPVSDDDDDDPAPPPVVVEDPDPEEIYYKFICEVTSDSSGVNLKYTMDTSFEPVDQSGNTYYYDEFGTQVNAGGTNNKWQECYALTDMVPQCKDPRNGNPTTSNLNFIEEYVIATYGSASSASSAAVSDYDTMKGYTRNCTGDEI